MVLRLHATSIRGRKAYKDDTDTIYLECTSGKSIKPDYTFQKQSNGFLNRRYNCYDCRSVQNKLYRLKEAKAN
ncbi:hypothetical protein FTE28_21665 [Bacillus licheniformis]|nr:hypothetical protein AB684_04700 [Bacillus licheniformis]KUL09623.1 hypothetical protein LI17339_13825 [Bacillus licheniformis LMG 17339]AWV39762.1 hypothetical protein CD200_04785 [Bacillus licheniformis]AZN80440.1 hypothetical protein CXG95_15505 [Bacillus licheniformis]PLS10565.1 hypothetical protein CWM45_20805 [Bacillus licheniformis]